MPLRNAPIVEWPPALAALLQEAEIKSGNNGKLVCHCDVDVDAETLRTIHEFEAHLRRRLVQLRLAVGVECMIGEMNPSFSIGAPSDRGRNIARVRLSFHDLQSGECVDLTDHP